MQPPRAPIALKLNEKIHRLGRESHHRTVDRLPPPRSQGVTSTDEAISGPNIGLNRPSVSEFYPIDNKTVIGYWNPIGPGKNFVDDLKLAIGNLFSIAWEPLSIEARAFPSALSGLFLKRSRTEEDY
jgi:hypothetical protein